MWSAGICFFCRIILPLRRGIAVAFQKQIDLRCKVHVGDEVYQPITGVFVLDHRVEDAFLGIGAERGQIALPQLEHPQFLTLPQQTPHIGLAGYALVVLCQCVEKCRQIFAAGGQQLNGCFRDL